MNANYRTPGFRVRDLPGRWDREDSSVSRQAISRAMHGTSQTTVFVGSRTWASRWVREEVAVTIENGNPECAIRVPDSNVYVPPRLAERGIVANDWSEATLQNLATR